MNPVVALVGRPNVGKSTLFNHLTQSRDALVNDQPGITRDRIYGQSRLGRFPFLVVDTGGIDGGDTPFSGLVRSQVLQVLQESKLVLFLVDSSQGLVQDDLSVADLLRRSGVEVQVLANKADMSDRNTILSEFAELGLTQPLPISARRGQGIAEMLERVEDVLGNVPGESDDVPDVPGLAIVGRPNVGKSTLVNRLVGENRMIVSDRPGTTRDSIRIPVTFQDQSYELIDTAGVRRKSRITEVIEKFSVVKTLQAIEHAQVALLVLDAGDGLNAQDMAIAGMIHDLGRSLVVALNKWDGLERSRKREILRTADNRLSFLPGHERISVSALHGSNVAEIMPAMQRALDSALVKLPTSSLNRVLAAAVRQTPPPMYHGRPIKPKYAHQGGRNPPVVIVHGTHVNQLTPSYRRYLARCITRSYGLTGTPVRILARETDNPFAAKGASITSQRNRSGRGRGRGQ